MKATSIALARGVLLRDHDRMPRTTRQITDNGYYHVINRANGGARVFNDHGDYAHFVALMRKATERVPLSVLAVCLMPNHVHIIVRPKQARDLARWTQWLFTTHVRRYHAIHSTIGHVWQGRYKAFVIEDDGHMLTVMRYVERNALRSGMVGRAEDWLWGSLRWRQLNSDSLALAKPPVRLPANWIEIVNQPQTPAELDAIRTCVNRQRPFGSSNWVETKARELGLTQSLRPIGRPRGTK